MKKLFQILACAAVICSMTVACEKTPEEGGEGPSGGGKTPLATPVLSLSRQTGTSVRVSWDLVEGAGMYAYEVNGKGANTAENFVDVTGLSVDVAATIRVRAIAADTKKYSDSEWAEITYTPSWFTQVVALSDDGTSQSNPYNAIDFTWSGSDVKSVKYAFFLTEVIESSSEEELKSFLATEGLDISAEFVGAINDGGADSGFKYLQSGTSYSLIALATNKSNDVKFVRDDISTDSSEYGDTPTDDYNSYLGTYEITSTDSQVQRKGSQNPESAGPQTFQIELMPAIINGSYWFTWGIDKTYGLFDAFAFTGLYLHDETASLVALAAGELLEEGEDGINLGTMTLITLTNPNTGETETGPYKGIGEESYAGYLVNNNGSYSIELDEGEVTSEDGVKYQASVNGFTIKGQDSEFVYTYYDVITPLGPYTVKKIEEQAAPALKSIARPLVLNKEYKKRAALSSVMEVAPMAKKISLK